MFSRFESGNSFKVDARKAKNADNLQAERNLNCEIVGQMHRLKTAQRRA